MTDLRTEDLDEDGSSYWMKQQKFPKYEVWKGFAFERLCMIHLGQIKAALGIGSVITEASKWAAKGAEIEWVIDRNDGCINLFEAEFVPGEFLVTKQTASNLRNKKMRFKEKTKTRNALFANLITPYGAAQNSHHLSSVDNSLTIEALLS